MRINHNISALNTYRQLNANSTQTSKALEKLSSGLRINKAGDDAAGLAISEKMRAQIRGLDQASRNAQDAISMIQTAEGALNETQSILQRMRELATQASSDTNVDQDRTEIQKEMNQLTSEINRIGNTTEFNTKKLLDGGPGSAGSVAYTEGVKGAASKAPTGAADNFAVLQNSIAKGTADVSSVSVDKASVKGAGSVIGQVSSSVTSVKDSIKGGQGATADFKLIDHSTKAASSGALGSPAAVTQSSINTGSMVISAGGVDQAISVVNTGRDDKGTYTYNVDTTKFANNDTITIGGKTFTKASADDAANGEFTNAAGLVAAMNHANAFDSANATTGYTASAGTGNDIILKRNMAGADTAGNQSTIKPMSEMIAENVAATAAINGAAAVAARYSFDSNFINGLTNTDTLLIGGKTYTKAATTTAASGQFADVAGLVASMNDATAGLGSGYTASVGTGADLGKIIITKAPAGVDATAGTISATVKLNGSNAAWGTVNTENTGTAATQAVYDYTYADFGTLANGDKVTIGGKTFTKAASTNATAGQFADMAGLISSLNNATAGITGYTAAANGGTGIRITKTATGPDANIATMPVAKRQLAAGGIGSYETVNGESAHYAFELYKNATAGDTFKIGGETFQAVNKAGDPVTTGNVAFTVGANEFDTAANLAKAMNDRAQISTQSLKDYSVAVDVSDKNLIHITGNVVRQDSTATANDFTIGGAGTAAVTQGVGQAGIARFEIASNFAEGQKVNIGGIEFLAGLTTDASKNQFTIGADPAATAKNLYDLITNAANATKYAAIVDNYTLTDPSTQALAINKDTIVMTEKTGHYSGKSDTDLLGSLGFAVTDSTQQLGKASFQITTNFVAGNTLKIGGITLTAVGEEGSNSATAFKVGKTIEDTVANIKAALDANGKYTVGTEGKKLTLTEKAAGGTDLASGDITTTGTTKQAGEYTFDILKNFDAGEKITIDGREFTAVTGGAKAGQFAIGSSEGDAANNLINAINNDSVLKDKYAATVNGTTVKLTEKAGADTNYSGMKAPATPVVASPTVVKEVQGEYSFKVTSSFSGGDKLNLAGETFEAGKDFAVGANVKETLDNLAAAINGNANIGFAKRFEATVLTDSSKNILEPEYSIKLTEKAGMATADNAVSAAVTQREAQKGTVKFDISKNFITSDQLAIDDITLSAGDKNTASSFAIGGNVAETAANIKSSIESNESLNNKYDVIVSGSTIALQEKQASGVNTAAPVVTNSATKGVYQFELPALGKESSVSIDGRDLVFKKANATEAETAGQVKELIEKDAVLKDKYSVEVDGSTVKLTQKSGAESEQGPNIGYKVAQGSGFSARMQIGANTGQSLNINVNDMRAKALGVSVVEKVDQTVEVDGKQYQVAWTENTAVTNGTDDVNTEYSLNVSTYESATASIKVIDTAINSVSAERSKLGAFQNRLEHTINNLGTSSENLTAAESRIRDVDMAKEMMEFTKDNILSQAAQAMLAQANQQPQGVLQLLR